MPGACNVSQANLMVVVSIGWLGTRVVEQSEFKITDVGPKERKKSVCEVATSCLCLFKNSTYLIYLSILCLCLHIKKCLQRALPRRKPKKN